LHTPNSPQENSPEDENELATQYNPGTTEKPMMDEGEFLAQFSIIEPQYNPVTMGFIEPDED
jgi:hypothetical protein